MSRESLHAYYAVNSSIVLNKYKYSIEELENMFPWERDIYISLLEKHLEEENERIARENRELGLGR